MRQKRLLMCSSVIERTAEAGPSYFMGRLCNRARCSRCFAALATLVACLIGCSRPASPLDGHWEEQERDRPADVTNAPWWPKYLEEWQRFGPRVFTFAAGSLTIQRGGEARHFDQLESTPSNSGMGEWQLKFYEAGVKNAAFAHLAEGGHLMELHWLTAATVRNLDDQRNWVTDWQADSSGKIQTLKSNVAIVADVFKLKRLAAPSGK